MSAIADLLAVCRRDLDRVEPRDLAAEVAAGALLVDTRPAEQRHRDGDLPGAVVIDRNVLEWRLDPTSPHRIPAATGPDLRVVVVCDEGFSSSLAAHTLRALGLRRATDLVGGYQAWRRTVAAPTTPTGGLPGAGVDDRPGVAPQDPRAVVETASQPPRLAQNAADAGAEGPRCRHEDH